MLGVSEKTIIRIRKYCAYQERSQQEVRDKLYTEGLHKKEIESLIAALISEGFINEERFAIAFAGGKFRIKKWGKIKIIHSLRAKKISEYCIKKSLQQISDSEYKKTLSSVIASYSKQVKETDERKRNYKIAGYAISRGFEPEYVWEAINEL